MRRAALLAVVGLAVWAPVAVALPGDHTVPSPARRATTAGTSANVIVNWTITPLSDYTVDSGCAASTFSHSTRSGTKLSMLRHRRTRSHAVGERDHQ